MEERPGKFKSVTKLVIGFLVLAALVQGAMIAALYHKVNRQNERAVGEKAVSDCEPSPAAPISALCRGYAPVPAPGGGFCAPPAPMMTPFASKNVPAPNAPAFQPPPGMTMAAPPRQSMAMGGFADPSEEMDRMMAMVREMFDGADFADAATMTSPFGNGNGSAAETSAPDIRVENNRYVARVPMPGLDKATLDVRVDGRLVTVSGEKTENAETKQNGFYSQSFGRMSFQRSFSLPGKADGAKAKVNYENDMLTITVPMTS